MRYLRAFVISIISWLRRTLAWLRTAQLLAFTLAVVAAALWISFGLGTEKTVRLSGVGLQLLGIAAAAFGIRDTRRMFGKPSLLQSIRSWFAARPKRNGTAHIVGAVGLASATSFGRASGSVGTPAGAPIQQQIDALEKNLRALDGRLNTAEGAIETNQRDLDAKLASEAADRAEADRLLGLRIEAAQTDGLSLAAAGALWLAVGIVLSTAPNELLSLVGNA